MSETCGGWRIVCPDGRVRHCPFHNEEDGQFDAKLYTGYGFIDKVPPGTIIQAMKCRTFNGDPPEWSNPPCPQGKHTVEMIAFDHG